MYIYYTYMYMYWLTPTLSLVLLVFILGFAIAPCLPALLHSTLVTSLLAAIFYEKFIVLQIVL